MKKIAILFISIFMSGNAFSQSNKSLSQLLWDRVKNCSNNFEDMDEDGSIDFEELIDDSKNGYLKVSGTWPTCGCGCSKTVAAYKGSNGGFTLIDKENWNCNWLRKISSNRNLKEVLPEGFGINSFIPEGFVNPAQGYAFFYLDIELPHYGTDTKVQIKPIPFGMQIQSKSPLAYEISENESYSNCKNLSAIGAMANKIKNDKTLDLLLNNRLAEISKNDMAVINSFIGEDYGPLATIEVLRNELVILKKVYDMYMSIGHEYIILSWSRENGRFLIKENGKATYPISFKQFLSDSEYWGMVC